jgi:hypothetical protein
MAVRMGKTAKSDAEASDLANQSGNTMLSDNQKTSIDLRMASTYIAGFVCLFKASLITLLLSRSWAIENMKIHVCLYLYIMVDRIVYEDGVFDTNAANACILVMQTINVFRSDPTFHLSQEHMWNKGIAVVYATFCVALTADLDLVQIYRGIAVTHTTTLRISTILMHCVLFTCVLFSKPSSSIIASNWIIIRSIAFITLSIVWSYVCGVPNMILLLRSSKRIQLTCMGKGAFLFSFFLCQSYLHYRNLMPIIPSLP